jgi:hypothetical protein
MLRLGSLMCVAVLLAGCCKADSASTVHTLKAGGLTASLRLAPSKSGANRVIVRFTGAGGKARR